MTARRWFAVNRPEVETVGAEGAKGLSDLACPSRSQHRAKARLRTCCDRYLNRDTAQGCLPAEIAYTVGMSSIQYTIRGVPPVLDAELRREASTSGKTLNAVVVETLERAKLPLGAVVHDDLDWFVGSLPPDDKAFEEAQTWLDALPVEPR